MMKRYVLLDKEIVDTSENEFYNISRINKKDNLYKDGFHLGTVNIQSDNLLDLLEIGDMIEWGGDFGLDNNITMLTNDTILEFYKNNPHSAIAIWKRNGDVMRRYEL